METKSAAQLRSALRKAAPDTEWRPLHLEAMQVAYAARDHRAVAQLAAMAGIYLEAEGKQRDALAEIQFGLALTSANPESHAHMLRVRAWFELMAGEPATARESLAAAATTSPPSSPAAAIDQAFRLELISLIGLEHRTTDGVAAVGQQADDEGLEALSAFGKFWIAVGTASRGEASQALPWANALEVHGQVHGNRWRVAEARELRQLLRMTRERIEDCEHPAEPDIIGRGYIAEWLHAGLSAYRAIRFRQAEPFLDPPSWKWARERLPQGYRTAGNGFQAVVDAHVGGEWSPSTPPPRLTLLNAGAALATAEATAVAGTQSAAAAWTQWLNACWPEWMHTTAEWPASVARVEALLLARAGDLRAAIPKLRAAVTWSTSAAYEVERAVSLIQLAELLALAPGGTYRQKWSAIRSEGRQLARDLGVDASGAADAAVSAAALGKFDAERPQLTRREVEVLDLFREGLTYREVGSSLGLDWRTVQTHAKNIYAKLEVNSKTSAVIRAGELGFLQRS